MIRTDRFLTRHAAREWPGALVVEDSDGAWWLSRPIPLPMVRLYRPGDPVPPTRNTAAAKRVGFHAARRKLYALIRINKAPPL